MNFELFLKGNVKNIYITTDSRKDRSKAGFVEELGQKSQELPAEIWATQNPAGEFPSSG